MHFTGQSVIVNRLRRERRVFRGETAREKVDKVFNKRYRKQGGKNESQNRISVGDYAELLQEKKWDKERTEIKEVQKRSKSYVPLHW